MIELKDGSLITGGIELKQDLIAARMFEMLNDRLSDAVGGYENDNFGEANIEIEPCKIANMLVYIYGEYLLRASNAVISEQLDRELTEEDLEQIEARIARWCGKNLPYNSNNRTLEEQVWDYYGSY